MVERTKQLRNRVETLRRAQSDLKELRRIGVDESAIRGVMSMMGFGNVNPEELLPAGTLEEVERLIARVGLELN